MEFMIPIYRIIHFLGMALLFGGTLCSIVLVRKSKASIESALLAWNCMHLVAVPGLLILIATGVLHSYAIYWENFKGTGYMYAKIFLVGVVFILIFMDMRTQKAIIRNKAEPEVLVDMVKKRQMIALISLVMTIIIIWLISYRPF